jgi:lipopolysaccharide export system permease protein
MVFYFLSNTGQKFAKEGSMSPFVGMWLSTFILVPIGIFLTYKALRDSQLFNKEFYFRLRGNLRKTFKKVVNRRAQLSAKEI